MEHVWLLFKIINLDFYNLGADIYRCNNCGFEKQFMFAIRNDPTNQCDLEVGYDPETGEGAWYFNCDEYLFKSVLD